MVHGYNPGTQEAGIEGFVSSTGLRSEFDGSMET